MASSFKSKIFRKGVVVMMFKLNLQLLSSKKGVGSTNKCSDSVVRCIGAKVADRKY